MSTLIGTGSIDSSHSLVEIDSENTSSSLLSPEEDIKPSINLTPSSTPPLSSPTTAFLPTSSPSPFKQNFCSTMGGLSIPHHGLSAAFHGYHSNHTTNTNNSNKSPFLLPAQLYKSLFASAVLQNPDKIQTPAFPRNLLFSCAEKSPNSDSEMEEKCPINGEEVNFMSFCSEEISIEIFRP